MPKAVYLLKFEFEIIESPNKFIEIAQTLTKTEFADVLSQ